MWRNDRLAYPFVGDHRLDVGVISFRCGTHLRISGYKHNWDSLIGSREADQVKLGDGLAVQPDLANFGGVGVGEGVGSRSGAGMIAD
jgi:hypothetical protein